MDQFVIEEFISGINTRTLLIDAYSDIALLLIDSKEIPQILAKSLGGLMTHLVGRSLFPMDAKDKKIFSECLDILESLGEFAAEYDVLRAVCQQLYEFTEIADKDGKKKLFTVFSKIFKACSEFEPSGPNCKAEKESKDRQAVVKKYWDKAKRLS